jgi:hypothetical protein
MPLPDVRFMDETFTDYLDFNVENTVGTLLVVNDCDWLREGRVLAGTYTVSIEPGSINTGVTPKTATINVIPDHSTHPQHPDHEGGPATNQFTGVLLDGSTEYTTMVPDVLLVFADYATGVVDTWESEVTTGLYLGNFADGNPTGDPPGEAVYEARVGVKNTSANVVQDVTVSIENPVGVLWAKAGTGLLDDILVREDTVEEKEAVGTLQTRPYKFSAANLSGDTIDILVDGELLTSVRDLDTNATSTSAGLTRGHRFRVEDSDLADGNLDGLEFTIDAAAANADTCNVTVWDRRGMEISADDGGSPDDYTAVSVNLGDLAAAAGEHVHFRASANIGSGEKNPHQMHLALSYLRTGVAAIEEA